MSVTAQPASPAPDHHAQFIELLSTSLAQNAFIKLVLAKYVGDEAELQRLIIKAVTVKEQPCLSFVYRYKTRDITKNLALADGVAAIAALLPGSFKNAHLLSLTDEAQLEYSKKNKSSLFRSKPQQLREAPSAEHNREKHRFLDLSRPFLADLGVTDARQALIPSMSRKWKQINKFIEVFSHALTSSPLKLDQPVRVADFGSGKGYLTFAIHDYLRNTLKAEGEVTGVELREDMVTLCNTAAARLEHRALFLEACGYETKVFEFISLEHTNKNKMILAVKRAEPVDNAQLLERIQELKAFYHVSEHCLETLLRADGYLK